MKRSSSELKAKNRFKRNQLLFIWGGLAIPLISWFVFWFCVHIGSFVQAFQDPYTNDFSFVNFQKFWIEITNQNNRLDSLSVAIKNTMGYFVLHMFVEFPIDIIISYFLYKKIKGYKFFRIVFYFPVLVSAVVLTGVFKELISPLGPLGELCKKLGFDMPSQGFLGTASTATKTIMVYDFWSNLCVSMLLLCGGMARIPLEVLESARLDGVRHSGQELIYFILPLTWPTISTMIILALTGIVGASGPILLLAPDSTSLGTTTLSYWLFDRVYAGGVFMQGQYNLVSAAGLCITAVVLPIILLLRKLVEKIPAVEY